MDFGRRVRLVGKSWSSSVNSCERSGRWRKEKGFSENELCGMASLEERICPVNLRYLQYIVDISVTDVVLIL
jgi:hypothetical protein